MNITLDLILPLIIVGLLITMIFTANVTMMKSSNENQLSYKLQNTANNVIKVVQEEVNGAQTMHVLNSNKKIGFRTVKGDSITIEKQNEDLLITKFGSEAGSNSYAAKLNDLNFDLTSFFLEIKVSTQSNPKEEFGQQSIRYRAFAERRILLNNVHMQTVLN